MKSRIFSSSMVKENLKQRIWIPALVTVGLIVLYPIYLMIQFDLWCDQKLTYEMIQRGYERFDEKLRALGGLIEKVDSEKETNKFIYKTGTVN